MAIREFRIEKNKRNGIGMDWDPYYVVTLIQVQSNCLRLPLVKSYIYRVGQKMACVEHLSLTLSNINRFSKFFHCQNQSKICNNIIT